MLIDLTSDEYFMREALKEASAAMEEDEVPVGAVIVSKGRIIARAHNMTERLNDVTAHAEMLAFTAASGYLGSKFLEECQLFVTVEPCLMCAGAAFWTRIGRLVYGATDLKRGFSLAGNPVLHPSTEVISGVLEEQCSRLMIAFFEKKR